MMEFIEYVFMGSCVIYRSIGALIAIHGAYLLIPQLI